MRTAYPGGAIPLAFPSDYFITEFEGKAEEQSAASHRLRWDDSVIVME